MKWTDTDLTQAIDFIKSGYTFEEISQKLGRTPTSIRSKLNHIGFLFAKETYDDETLSTAIRLFEEGKNFKQISLIIGKSHGAITQKLHRLGIKGNNYDYDKGKTRYSKYKEVKWDEVQKYLNDGKTIREALIEFNLISYNIIRAKEEGVLKVRTPSEAAQLARKQGKFKKSDQIGINRYRQLCAFDFGVKRFPEEFDLSLIQKHGWYSATNRGGNIDGVSRDHMLSIKDGFDMGILPMYMKHPANCQLMLQRHNSNKNTKSSLSLDELINKIDLWETKYGDVTEWAARQ